MKNVSARPVGQLGAAALVFCVACGPIHADSIGLVYLAGVWDDDSVHGLTAGLADIGAYPAGASKPNALTTNGTEVWSGHASTHEVIIYNSVGQEIGRWEDPAMAHLQGMAIISPTELAIATDRDISLYDPYSGAFVRTIPVPNLGVYTEGLAWDGEVLWRLALHQIIATNITDGSTVAAINNPALWLAGQPGRGLASNAPGQLTIAGETGDWWVVETTTGKVIISGSSAPSTYALDVVVESIAIPEPITASVLLAGFLPLLLVRRRHRR